MREILFRGQHIKYGQYVNMAGEKLPGVWVYGGIFPGTGDHSIIYGGKSESFTGAEIDKWPVYSDTVGQYTGLTDKNGKKIFEGDIVTIQNDTPFEMTGEVVFDGGCFELHDPECDMYECLWYKPKEMTVLGNIHDNPELLEGGD